MSVAGRQRHHCDRDAKRRVKVVAPRIVENGQSMSFELPQRTPKRNRWQGGLINCNTHAFNFTFNSNVNHRVGFFGKAGNNKEGCQPGSGQNHLVPTYSASRTRHPGLTESLIESSESSERKHRRTSSLVEQKKLLKNIIWLGRSLHAIYAIPHEEAHLLRSGIFISAGRWQYAMLLLPLGHLPVSSPSALFVCLLFVVLPPFGNCSN